MNQATPPVLAPIAYEQFLADVEAVAHIVEQDGWRPDFIVGIGRGGLAPGAFLSHRMGIAMLSVDHSSKVPGFADELLVKLAEISASGKRLLFVDDINDSGTTIAYHRDSVLEHAGVAANIRFAVLVNNIRSRAHAEYAAREIDRDVDKQWFVFPWESVAPVATLLDEAVEVPERLGLG